MPGIYGDLLNLARNNSMEIWNEGTNTTTSGSPGPDLWVLGVGTGSTLNVSRASTGQDSGTFCAGVAYTHVLASELHQVAALVNEMKGQTLSFAIKAATATARACRPWVSSDGGTTKTYGNPHTGSSATVYEVLKVEGFAVPSGATALWYGLEFNVSATVLIDAVTLSLGSAANQSFGPQFPKSAAWSVTSGATGRSVDMTGTSTTLIPQALGTLIKDLQAAGILGV